MDNAFPCIPLVVTQWKKNISHMWGNLHQWPYLILCFNNYFGAVWNFQHCWACWLLPSVHCSFEQFTYFENVNIASVLSFPSTQHLTAIHTKEQKLERRWDLNSVPLKMAAKWLLKSKSTSVFSEVESRAFCGPSTDCSGGTSPGAWLSSSLC